MDPKRFRDHDVWVALAEIKEKLANEEYEVRRLQAFSELRDRLNYLEWILDKSEPSLITENELQQFTGELQNIKNVVFQGGNYNRKLSQTDNHFKNILTLFPYARVPRIFKSEVNEVVQDFESQFQALLERSERTVAEFEGETDRLSQSVKSSNAKLSEISEKMAKVDAQIETQLGNWETRVETDVTQALNELRQRGDEQEQTRRKTLQAELEALSAKVKEIEKTRSANEEAFESAINEMRGKISEEQEKTRIESEDYLRRIRELFRISGETALAGHFERAAQDEKKLGDIFSLLAVILFVSTPIVLMVMWQNIDFASGEIEAYLVKLTSALTFLVPAAYFGNTAQRHRRVATALRSLGVRVATFDAYLADMSEDERKEIKTEMAELFFSGQISPDRLRTAGHMGTGKILDSISSQLDRIESMIFRRDGD